MRALAFSAPLLLALSVVATLGTSPARAQVAEPAAPVVLYLDPDSEVLLRAPVQSALMRRLPRARLTSDPSAAHLVLYFTAREMRPSASDPPHNRPVVVTGELRRGEESFGPFAVSGALRDVATPLAERFARALEALEVVVSEPLRASDVLVGPAPGEKGRPLGAGHLGEGVATRAFNLALGAMGRSAFHEAAAWWDRYLALRPADPFGHFNRGLTFLNLEDWREAAESFERATAIQPSNDLAYYNLGFALSKLGRLRDARRALEGALELNPEYEDARRLLEEITRRRR